MLLGAIGTLPTLAADAPSATPDQLAILDEILGRPEFRAAESRSAFDRLLDPIRSWFRWLAWEAVRLLLWLLSPVLGEDGRGDVLRWTIVGVSVAIVIVTGVMLRRLARGTLVEDAATAGVRAAGPPRADEELARARTLALAGDARQAVHHHYRALLLRLDERDHLTFDSALTNRELLPRLTAAPELAGPFADLVTRFDRLWYGQTHCTLDEYADFAQRAERVWQAAGRVAPARPSRPAPASAGGSARTVGGSP